ncbi:MAG: hypothetical protein GWP91_20095 [Rhodobacterales bacterium]|nr:hypothetical protein [Rhodobacterales bacterium]
MGPVLPQNASASQRLSRSRSLFSQRQAYEWVHAPGQPPYVKDVPPAELFNKKKSDLWKLDVEESVADMALAAVLRLRGHTNTIASFNRYYPLRKIPSTAERWSHDAEFARQRLDGINPTMIHRITELPGNFPLTNEHLGKLIDGHTLNDLLAEGRLFVCDYVALDGIPLVYGRFLTAPIALFWLDNRRRLMPLAIQLGQDPTEAKHIFTPNDPKWTWLLARAHMQAADASYHETVAHLTRTHLVMETFWVAACRSLPAEHPLHVLLQPHFTDTLEINHEARTVLIAPGGPIDKAIAVGSNGGLDLVANEYANWSFEYWEFEADLTRRGVSTNDDMPNYHYRDDARAYHQAISAYVNDMLRVFYKTPNDLTADTELQAWVQELLGTSLKGLPFKGGKITSFKQLHRMITQIIFTVSVEHSAVNNGQYDVFGWIPNAPGALYLPPPTDNSPRSEANFVYALPPITEVGQQLTLVHLLSNQTQFPLGTYDDDFFAECQPARAAVDRFRATIAKVGKDINDRNNTLDVP